MHRPEAFGGKESTQAELLALFVPDICSQSFSKYLSFVTPISTHRRVFSRSQRELSFCVFIRENRLFSYTRAPIQKAAPCIPRRTGSHASAQMTTPYTIPENLRRQLGNTGIYVSPIGFGASTLGNEFGTVEVRRESHLQNVSVHGQHI